MTLLKKKKSCGYVRNLCLAMASVQSSVGVLSQWEGTCDCDAGKEWAGVFRRVSVTALPSRTVRHVSYSLRKDGDVWGERIDEL